MRRAATIWQCRCARRVLAGLVAIMCVRRGACVHGAINQPGDGHPRCRADGVPCEVAPRGCTATAPVAPFLCGTSAESQRKARGCPRACPVEHQGTGGITPGPERSACGSVQCLVTCEPGVAVGGLGARVGECGHKSRECGERGEARHVIDRSATPVRQIGVRACDGLPRKPALHRHAPALLTA